MSAIGEPEVIEVRERSGNAWTKGTVTVTEFAVETISVVVPGRTAVADPNVCTGSELIFDVISRKPTARIFRTPSFASQICALNGIEDGEVRLSQGVRNPLIEVVIDDVEEPLKVAGNISLRGWSGSATADLNSLMTGEKVADLTIDVTLQRDGKRGQETFTGDGVTLRVSWVPHRALIRVTTSDGRTGTAECYTEDVLEMAIIRPPSR